MSTRCPSSEPAVSPARSQSGPWSSRTLEGRRESNLCLVVLENGSWTTGEPQTQGLRALSFARLFPTTGSETVLSHGALFHHWLCDDCPRSTDYPPRPGPIRNTPDPPVSHALVGLLTQAETKAYLLNKAKLSLYPAHPLPIAPYLNLVLSC